LWDAPDVVVPAVGVSVQEIPDIPEPTVPELSSRPIPPAFDLPIPVTVINWPAALRPVQAAPPATEEQAEPVEEEEDIDKEFEKELEPEPTLSPPKFGLPVAPKPEIPAVPPAATIPPVIVPKPPAPKIPAPIVDVPGLPDFPELPESEAPVVEPPPVDIPVPEIEPPTPVELPVPDLPNSPKLPENGIPLIELPPAEVLEIVPVSAEVPGPDAPAPVTVENWERMPVSPALPAQEIPEILEPVDSKTPIVIPPPPVEIPAPKIIPPAATIPPVDIPETPESEPPTIPAPAVSVPALDTPLPVTVINWPDTLKPMPAVPLTEEERVTPADEGSDIDDAPEFGSTSPNRRSCGRTSRQIQIPKIQVPDIVAAAMPPDPDAGALTRILGLIGGGETRVVVELDGYAIGETLFRTWNRRTGGALNG
jgi:hypothetical protein